MQRKKNVTVKVPKELLKQVRHLAVERETSVSGLVARLVQDRMNRDPQFRGAMEAHRKVAVSARGKKRAQPKTPKTGSERK
ncbi:hypothetical protein K8I61_11780 [bacterium]|nr:hypothetical protein [bacterium]